MSRIAVDPSPMTHPHKGEMRLNIRFGEKGGRGITEKRNSFLFTLFVLSTMFIAASLVPSIVPVTPSSSIQVQPWHDLAPPPSVYSGSGLNMDLTESMNGWQAWSLLANNTFADWQNRNDSFSCHVPTGYNKAWQNLTISNVVAANDVREVQGGSPANPLTDWFLCGTKDSPNRKYPALAMSFVPVDRINLTKVSVYYGATGSPPDIPLNIETDSSGKPSGVILGAGTLSGLLGADWHTISVSASSGRPITLSGGVRYWIVMNGSVISAASKFYSWFYVKDPGSGYDSKLASYYPDSPSGWQQESAYGTPYNFLALAMVIPVDNSLQPKRYNSPAQVYMWLNKTSLNQVQIMGNTTNIPNSYLSFTLSTNTSVSFAVNLMTRFEKPQSGTVSTTYIATHGATYWNATFSSDSKPSGVLQTVYNHTLYVTPIASYWQLSDPSSNVTNTNKINFTVGWTYGQGYLLITQADDVNRTDIWSADWRIMAKSTYAVSASSPLEVIQGQAFDVSVTASVLPSSRKILVYDRSDSLLYNRTFSVALSLASYPLKLNATGDNDIIVFDRGTAQNEASFFNASWITVLRALTHVSLESSTINTTWGDQIHIRVQYQNATQSSIKPFPSTPLPVFDVGGYVVPSAKAESGGWYSFNYSSSLQSAAGNHSLVVSCGYEGTYNNVTTLNLNLAKVRMTVSIIMDQTGVSVGSSLTASAMLTYQVNGSFAPNGFNIRFDFVVMYKNGTVATITKYESISTGQATSSILATVDMESITLRTTYLGTSILDSATSERANIPVTAPQGLPIMLLAGVGIVGALVPLTLFVVRARRRKGKEDEVRDVTRLEESASLAQLVVVDKAGRCVYSRKFGTEEAVDIQLLSGFLSANQSLLGEVFRGQEKGGLKFADYGEYKVVTETSEHIMSTLFCTEKAGQEIRNALADFTKRFEEKYGKSLETWDGSIETYRDADEIFDNVFSLPLTCPYTIMEDKLTEAKLSGIEKKAIDRAKRISTIRGFFFMPKIIDFLITEEKLKRSKVMSILDSLANKAVLKQLTLEEAEALMSAKEREQA